MITERTYLREKVLKNQRYDWNDGAALEFQQGLRLVSVKSHCPLRGCWTDSHKAEEERNYHLSMQREFLQLPQGRWKSCCAIDPHLLRMFRLQILLQVLLRNTLRIQLPCPGQLVLDYAGSFICFPVWLACLWLLFTFSDNPCGNSFAILSVNLKS